MDAPRSRTFKDELDNAVSIIYDERDRLRNEINNYKKAIACAQETALKVAEAFDKGYCAALQDAAELADNIFGGNYLWLNEGILGLADHDFDDLLSSEYRRDLIKNSEAE